MPESNPTPQITLTGRILDGGNIKDGSITLDLDDAKADGGRAVSFELYQHLVENFNSQITAQTPVNTKVAYVINKQLLMILLSSKNCTGLLLSKCLRKNDDGVMEESIAFTAVDDTHHPIGTQKNPVTHKIEATPGKEVPSAEWIHGITVEEEINEGVIIINTIDKDNNFNFNKYSTLLKKKASEIL